MADKISIWPKDEAKRNLLQAILIFNDLHGSHDTTTFLQQEITREIVVREYRASRKEALVAEAFADLARNQLSIATDALSYYADTSNHKSRNGKPSLVAEDKGIIAREALEAIDGIGTEVAETEADEPEGM